MKLISFAVRNYRSITGTSTLPIQDAVTAFIGPNNEGKTNLLRALVAALQVVTRPGRAGFTKEGKVLLASQWVYDWEKDYPIPLRTSAPTGLSQFDLEFELSDAEILEFKQEVGSSLNGSLPLRVSIGKTTLKFSVRKQGRGAATLSAKSNAIAAFIGKRIDFQYVPAVRPAGVATGVVQEMVSRELQALVANPEYQRAIDKIEELQKPVLQSISETARDTLKAFLPSVKAVEVVVPRDARSLALTKSCEVFVDDGTRTPLAQKGDGIQSLAALSLMRRGSKGTAQGKQLILAVEEPESHLHPNAIHQLREVLDDIAHQHQVIITTHCAVFVDRRDLQANILVTMSSAAPSASLAEIRDALGVRVSDNMRSAEVVLLVEGEHDRGSIGALLGHASPSIAQALSNGRLAIDSLLGGSNLAYKLSQVRDVMCVAHALVDHDQAGKAAVGKAMAEGLLRLPDLTYTICAGMRESEIEDWYDPSFYASVFSSEFGVSMADKQFGRDRHKWTDRMRALFLRSGKSWDDRLEAAVKRRLAEVVVARPEAAIHASRRSAFEALVTSVMSKLEKSVNRSTV